MIQIHISIGRFFRRIADRLDPQPLHICPKPPKPLSPPTILQRIDEEIERALKKGLHVNSIYLSHKDFNEAKRERLIYERAIWAPEIGKFPTMLYGGVLTTTFDAMPIAPNQGTYLLNGIVLEVR